MTRPIRLEWTCDLAGDPATVWPIVSDTNRMNRLAGLPPVTYGTRPGPDGKPQRTGAARIAGLMQRWDEHPFNWAFPYRFAVGRTFHGGLVASYTSTVTLVPTLSGTKLTHVVELIPRLGLLKPVVAFVANTQSAGWRKAYDAVAAHLFEHAPDPFEVPPDELDAILKDVVTGIERELIDGGHAAQLVERLVAAVATGDPLDLRHIRPYALADRWGVPRADLLAVCLDAARVGLLEPRWSHLCPHCRGPKAAAASLTDLAVEARCDDCDLDFTGTFDSSIELAFRPAPLIRPLDAHGSYCVAGPASTPHIAFQGVLAPGEAHQLRLPVPAGVYRLRGPWADGFVAKVLYRTGDQAPAPVAIDVGAAQPPLDAKPIAPLLAIDLAHTGAAPVRLVIERGAWDEQAVTAAAVAALPAFKTALGGIALADDAQFQAEALAMVALRPGPDAGAGWYDAARWALERAGGLIAHDAPDELVGAYHDARMALDVALDLVVPLDPDAPPCLVGADLGPCTAVGPGLRYVGEAVDRARDAAGFAQPNILVLGRGLMDGDAGRELVAAGEWQVASDEGDFAILFPAYL